VALVGGAGLLVLQLVPYGHSHVNLTIGAPTAAAAATCQTVFPPGDESTMRLSDFKARVAGQVMNLNRVLSGLAASSPTVVRAEYAQFADGYRGTGKDLAQLYPGRCPRLNDAAGGADRAIIWSPTIDTPAANQWIYALDVGLFNLSQDLDTRIRQAGPDQLVGLENPETDRPSITGAPTWNNARTQALVSRACGGCHSNQPNMPWFTNLAPLSWAIQYQVDAGRAFLNFSEWDRPQGAVAMRAASDVERGSMPPGWAAVLDPKLQLTDGERAEVVRGLLATFRTAGSVEASK
jgi:mono/diheme cytochrome c family protein